MNQDAKQALSTFQRQLKQMKSSNIFLVGAGIDVDGDPYIINSSSIDEPTLLIAGLAQLFAENPEIKTLFKTALKVADLH